MALPNPPRYTVEEYFQLEQDHPKTRYEYIDGYVHMLAGGTLDHTAISLNIYRYLYQSLQGQGCRIYTSDARVRLAGRRYVYPDLTVTCHEQDYGKQQTIYYPRLVVEVLSPGTMNYDRGEKFTYYRACPTLQEYVLVNTGYQTVEVFRREREDLWMLQMFRPDSNVELASLGVRIPVSANYEGTTVQNEDTPE